MIQFQRSLRIQIGNKKCIQPISFIALNGGGESVAKGHFFLGGGRHFLGLFHRNRRKPRTSIQ